MSRLDAQFLAPPVAQTARIQRIKVPLAPPHICVSNDKHANVIPLAEELYARAYLAKLWAVIYQEKKKKKENLADNAHFFAQRRTNFRRDKYISMLERAKIARDAARFAPWESRRGDTVKLFTACIMTYSAVGRQGCEKESPFLPLAQTLQRNVTFRRA